MAIDLGKPCIMCGNIGQHNKDCADKFYDALTKPSLSSLRLRGSMKDDILFAAVGPIEAKEYLFQIKVSDKPVNIIIGDKQYIGSREMLYDLLGTVLKEKGFIEMVLPERNKNE